MDFPKVHDMSPRNGSKRKYSAFRNKRKNKNKVLRKEKANNKNEIRNHILVRPRFDGSN